MPAQISMKINILDNQFFRGKKVKKGNRRGKKVRSLRRQSGGVSSSHYRKPLELRDD